MGTNEKLVPGELLIQPEQMYRETEIFKINIQSKLASQYKNINEEIAYV